MPPARLPVLQRCADRLTQRGHWQHDGRADPAQDAGWSWTHDGAASSKCGLLEAEEARRALAGRWVLVVGDSRARFIYAALLALLNSSSEAPPLGWPTHRVSHGTCMAHVVAGPSRPEVFGYYAEGCQLRWKGPCWDDVRGRNVRNVCTLDYRLDEARTRLTFQWHGISRPDTLALLSQRLELMSAASGGPPDVVFASTGTWDMLFGRLVGASGQPGAAPCCCSQVGATLDRVNRALTPAPGAAAPLKLLYGFFLCPTCEGEAAQRAGCAHWNASAKVRHYTESTQSCARPTAAEAGWLYFDVQRLTSAVPPGILASPCGNQHPFGVLAEAQAAALLSLVARARLPPPRHDRTNRTQLYGPSWPALATHCSSGAHCPPSSLAAKHLAEHARLRKLVLASRRYPGAAAGYCGDEPQQARRVRDRKQGLVGHEAARHPLHGRLRGALPRLPQLPLRLALAGEGAPRLFVVQPVRHAERPSRDRP